MPATIAIDEPTDELRETFELARSHFGHVPHLVRVLASNPTMCQSVTAFFAQALKDGRVSWAFKELVILKTLRTIKSYYSFGAHERLALTLGNEPERVADLANSLWERSPHYTAGERAVFRLVEQIGVDANDVGDDIWDELKRHWDDGQLIELNALITTFVMIGRTADALGASDPRLFTRPVP